MGRPIEAIAPADQEPDAALAEQIADEASALTKQLCKAISQRGPSIAPMFAGDAGRAFDELLHRELDPFAIVRRCRMKPFRFTVDRAHSHMVLRANLIIDGIDTSGVRISNAGDVDAELVRTEGKLRFARIEQARPRSVTPARVPELVDVTRESGLDPDFKEPAPKLDGLFPSLLGNGLAVADVDGDGAIDLYVLRQGQNLLYRSTGDGHFVESAEKLGVADPGNSRSAIFVDLDNDGDLDLVVVNSDARGLRLYRNDGKGHFSDVTANSGMARTGHFTGLAAADVDGDGLIDLYIGQYGVETKRPAHPLDAHDGKPNLLFHNLGNLRFEEVARQAGVAGREWTLAAALADLDGDLRPELLVVNDYGSPILYKNTSTPGTVSFTDVTQSAGLVDPGNGMGVDLGDVDGDGRPDIYLSKMYSTAGNRLLSQALDADPKSLALAQSAARGNSLFHNDGNLHFTEVGEDAGVRRAGWAWSCELADLDNDGDLDLHVANGFFTGKREDEL